MASRDEALREAFGEAAPDHFRWQTEGAFVSERERELCQLAFEPLGRQVLDLGCGEGATLAHLGAPEGAVGVDLFEDKIAFARTRLPGCTFVAASVYELPFDAGRFDHVLVRDVVHHLETPSRMIEEVVRVLAPGGRIDVLEPCRYNPLIFAHAVTQRAERGELRSTLPYLTRLVEGRFEVIGTSRHQPFPVHRIVFHPEMGRPALAQQPTVRRVVAGVEALAAKVVPAWAWAYAHVRGRLR